MEAGGITGGEARDQFLKLLVIQLRHQDPLDPVKQEDFLQQLAQFSTLERMEGLSDTMEEQVAVQNDLLRSHQISQAASLVGQTVVYTNVEGKTVSGYVDSIQLKADGTQLRIGSENITMQQIVEIGEPSMETDKDITDVS